MIASDVSVSPQKRKRLESSRLDLDSNESDGLDVHVSSRDMNITEGLKQLFEEEDREEIDEEQDFLINMQQKFIHSDTSGPDVRKQLADIINGLGNKKMDDERLKAVLNSNKLPSNCKLVVPKVNGEMWENVKPHVRSMDVKLQRIQHMVLKSVAAIAVAADGLMDLRNKLEQDQKGEIKKDGGKTNGCFAC